VTTEVMLLLVTAMIMLCSHACMLSYIA